MRFATLALPLLLVLPAAAQAPVPARGRDQQTALDRYVAAPDPAFAFKAVGALPGADGVDVTILELTSQTWLGPDAVDRPVWTHWLIVYRPATVRHDIGLLYIGGGDNDEDRPSRVNTPLLAMARDTGTIVAELRMVPNQPLTLLDDPARTPRYEDDLIAYTWDKYLRTGDERWPLRLPMTKAAVRAMDAITAWTSSPEGGGTAVRRFVVSGASKRGWTTWTTAAVDRRVVAIVPLVIDVLNVQPSFDHHWRVYGFWAPAVHDYVEHEIMKWMGTPEFAALMAIEDPWSYRARLTLPKYLVNSAGDQFFLPDSSHFYFDGLPGEKHLRYVPNTDHGLDDGSVVESISAFYASIVSGTPRPRFSWSADPDGTLRVTSGDRPERVRLWQATNPETRDFRLETIGQTWTATELSPSGPNTWVARVAAPPLGWTAWFVELTFPSGSRHPFTFTTDVRIVPDRVMHAPPLPAQTAGQH